MAARFDNDKALAAAQESVEDESDAVDKLWNVTMEDGTPVESIDPNDPKVQSVLQEEYNKIQQQSSSQSSRIPDSAQEKLLLLLTLLRERIKAEAAFSPDEKGRNLRLLAYCLRLSTNQEREQLILKNVGTSLDVSVIPSLVLLLFDCIWANALTLVRLLSFCSVLIPSRNWWKVQ